MPPTARNTRPCRWYLGWPQGRRPADRAWLIVYSAPVATTGGQSFWLNDRRVIVRTGTKSQTVNACTRQNASGEYEAAYRLPILSAVAASDVPEIADLHAFGAWLVETRNALARCRAWHVSSLKLIPNHQAHAHSRCVRFGLAWVLATLVPGCSA